MSKAITLRAPEPVAAPSIPPSIISLLSGTSPISTSLVPLSTCGVSGVIPAPISGGIIPTPISSGVITKPGSINPSMDEKEVERTSGLVKDLEHKDENIIDITNKELSDAYTAKRDMLQWRRRDQLLINIPISIVMRRSLKEGDIVEVESVDEVDVDEDGNHSINSVVETKISITDARDYLSSTDNTHVVKQVNFYKCSNPKCVAAHRIGKTGIVCKKCVRAVHCDVECAQADVVHKRYCRSSVKRFGMAHEYSQAEKVRQRMALKMNVEYNRSARFARSNAYETSRRISEKSRDAVVEKMRAKSERKSD